MRFSRQAGSCLPVLAGSQPHVDQVCGNRVTPSSIWASERPLRCWACSTCSALTMPSPVVWQSSASRWPEPSPPSCQPRAATPPAHSGRPPWRARIPRPAAAAPAPRPCWSSACRLRLARPDRWPADRPPSRTAARRRCRGGLGVDHLQPVGVSVQRDAVVGAVFGHRRHQRLRRGGTKTVVDVGAVGLAADGGSLPRPVRGTRPAPRGRPHRGPRRPRSSGPAATAVPRTWTCRTRCSGRGIFESAALPALEESTHCGAASRPLRRPVSQSSGSFSPRRRRT
jgi:hypothetical protein